MFTFPPVRRRSTMSFRPHLEPLEDRQAPATHVWSGAVSSAWSNPANWSSGGTPYEDPIRTAEVIFPATGVTNFRSVHDVPGQVDLLNIVILGGGYTLDGDAVAIREQIDDRSGGNNKIDFLYVSFDGHFDTQRINVASGGTLNVTCQVEGPNYALRKEGRGKLILAGFNNPAGFTLVQGRVVMGTSESLGFGPIEFQFGGIEATTNITMANPLIFSFFPNSSLDIDGSSNFHFTGNVSIAHVDVRINVGGSGFVRFDGIISGAGGISKFGDSFLTLRGDNTYEGGTYLKQGYLAVEHNNALGKGKLTLDGGTLSRGANGGLNITVPNSFEVVTESKGRISSAVLELTLTGAGKLNSDLEVTGGTVDIGFPLPPPIIIRISGPLSGPGRVAMVKEEGLSLGNYTLILGGGIANTYAGTTNVIQGRLVLDKSAGVNAIPGDLVVAAGAVVRLAAANQIADGAAVTVDASGAIEMNDFDDIWGSLEGNGLVKTADPPMLTVGGNNRSTTFGGVISGPGTVVKVGTGTWTLNGTNTHAGGTVVKEGTLLVNGTVGAVTVEAGATLGGTGTTGPVILSAGGAVSPGGAAAGIQKVQNLALAAGATFVVQLNGLIPGSDYDQLDVTGSVSLSGATLDASLGFSPAPGDTFVIIKNDGSDRVEGTFVGLPQGASFRINGVAFHIYYDRGEGSNDVVLVRNVAPAIARPGDQTAFQNVDLTVGAIGLSDPEDANLSVTLQVSHGVLTVGTAGLTVTGNGTASVSVSGSQAALNAALANLIYRASHNYSGLDTLTISASDGLDTSSTSVAIRVKSLAEQAAELQAQVNALRANVLNQGQANSLVVKLNLNDNDSDIGRVQAFLNEVEALLSAGVLNAPQANPLLGAGNVLLTGLRRR